MTSNERRLHKRIEAGTEKINHMKRQEEQARARRLIRKVDEDLEVDEDLDGADHTDSD